MDTVLGLLAFVVFVVSVIAFAAGVSWLVVKLSPKPKSKPPSTQPEA